MSERAEPEEVAGKLVVYLRTQLSTPELAVHGGTDADQRGVRYSYLRVHAVGRTGGAGRSADSAVFRDGGVETARFETVVQTAVAAQGYPAPSVLLTCLDPAVVDGAFMIMPSVAGTTMLDQLMGRGILRMSSLMGEQHARLHG